MHFPLPSYFGWPGEIKTWREERTTEGQGIRIEGEGEDGRKGGKKSWESGKREEKRVKCKVERVHVAGAERESDQLEI